MIWSWPSKPNKGERTKMLKTFLGYIPSYGLQSSALNRSPQHGKQLTSSFSNFSIWLQQCVKRKYRPLNATGCTRWWITWIEVNATSTLEPAPNSNEQFTLNLRKPHGNQWRWMAQYTERSENWRLLAHIGNVNSSCLKNGFMRNMGQYSGGPQIAVKFMFHL